MARPTTPLVYKFEAQSPTVTLLLAPRSAPRRGPVACISTALNLSPFAPLSYVTVVHRGESSNGVLIGQFEWVIFDSLQRCYEDIHITQDSHGS